MRHGHVVSSTWIGFDDELNGALLDTGEGTLGQLYRTFGEQRADQLISKLAFVFISHMHADHHVGLCRLMTHRQKVLTHSLSLTPGRPQAPYSSC